jgi:hypothetical protein
VVYFEAEMFLFCWSPTFFLFVICAFDVIFKDIKLYSCTQGHTNLFLYFHLKSLALTFKSMIHFKHATNFYWLATLGQALL